MWVLQGIEHMAPPLATSPLHHLSTTTSPAHLVNQWGCLAHATLVTRFIAPADLCAASPAPRVTSQVTCDFDSRGRDTITYAGATHGDEMCNLYMMVFSHHPIISMCGGAGFEVRVGCGVGPGLACAGDTCDWGPMQP